jgi:hypothetical protein
MYYYHLAARSDHAMYHMGVPPVDSRPQRGQGWWSLIMRGTPRAVGRQGDILFAVTEFFGTGSQVPLLLVIDAI